MNAMNEQKAYEMMSLNLDASKDEISKRYGILTRKFRTIEKDENGYTIDDITRAYNLLMGITYIDEREEERQRALREKPPFLARVLKKDPVKLENFFHYYRIHIIASFVLVVFLILNVRSCMNQVRPDFTVLIYGQIFTQDIEPIQEYIRENVTEIEAPDVQILITNEEDAQYQYTIMMKLMAMLAAQEVDVMIVDEDTFHMLAAQGSFLSLDDRIDGFNVSKEKYVRSAIFIRQTDEGEPIPGPEQIFGIDITNTSFIEDREIFGSKMIAVIVVNSKRIEKAEEFIRILE